MSGYQNKRMNSLTFVLTLCEVTELFTFTATVCHESIFHLNKGCLEKKKILISTNILQLHAFKWSVLESGSMTSFPQASLNYILMYKRICLCCLSITSFLQVGKTLIEQYNVCQLNLSMEYIFTWNVLWEFQWFRSVDKSLMHWFILVCCYVLLNLQKVWTEIASLTGWIKQ